MGQQAEGPRSPPGLARSRRTLFPDPASNSDARGVAIGSPAGGAIPPSRQLLRRTALSPPSICELEAGGRRSQLDMTTDLDSLMANLSASDRDRLKGAFAADPELASGLCTMLADLPADAQATMMRRLAVRLEDAPLGGGALIPALADVIEAAMKRPDSNPEKPPPPPPRPG